MWPPDVFEIARRQKEQNHMKKFAIALAVLAAAVVSSGSVIPRADFPPPPCVPDCAINIPS